MFIFAAVLFGHILLVTCVSNDHDSEKNQGWEYGSNGKLWPTDKRFPHCAETHQSPINIITKHLSDRVAHDPFKAVSEQVKTMTVENNGHSLQVNLDGKTTIKGGGLPGKFKAAQFHFHWGRTDEQGSEHRIDNEKFPLEMHIVHFNKKYGISEKAVNKTDGLAVIACLFKVSETDNPVLQKILDHPVVEPGNSAKIEEPFSPYQLLPEGIEGLTNFYRYDGSLTTPPCYETVQWTISKKFCSVSEDQLKLIREVRNHFKHRTWNNYRRPQELNRREVYDVQTSQNHYDRYRDDEY